MPTNNAETRSRIDQIRSSISDRGSTFSREILSGIVIYLSLIYIFIVNPEILSSAGTASDPMPAEAVLVATVITSALATMAMGYFANLPLAVAPGLEASTFFTYVLVNGMHLTWRQGLAAVFLSGILNVSLTYFSFREKIVETIPTGLKASLLLSVGSFILLVGLKIGGLVDVSSHTAFTHWYFSGDLKKPLIMLIGALLCFTINTRPIVLPWGIIVSVVICTGIALYMGIQPAPYHPISGSVLRTIFAFDFHLSSPIVIMNFVAGAMILFVIDFVGGLGKIVALTTHTSMQNANGKVDKLKEALYIDGLATTAGSILGTTSLIAFVESRLGIEAGARTGVSSLVCGLMMISGLLYAGAFRAVPPIATAGILLYIGVLLIRANFELLKTRDQRKLDVAIGILMVASILITFQMDWAMFIGFGLYFIQMYRHTATRKGSILMGGIALILGLSVITPWWIGMPR